MQTATETQPRIIEHVYRPRGAARDLFHAHDREILLVGPAGTGKSRAVVEKAHLLCHSYNDLRVMFLRKTRASVSESALNTFESIVLPPGDPARYLIGADGRRTRPSRNHRTHYEYPTGSRIVIGGMDQADKIMSTEFDLIIAFEAHELTEDDWEKLTTRLRNHKLPYQQAIADTNPSHPMHWLNLRAIAGKMTRLVSRHIDNPWLYEDSGTPTEQGEKYMAALGQLTGVRRLRLLNGQWAAAEGMVFADTWNESVNVIPRFDIPSDWRRYRSIDFGYDNPFVCQWWAQDGDGRLYCYREIYKSHLLLPEAINEIKRLSAGESYVRPAICDHDAGERAMLEAAGIETEAAYKDVSSTINAVADRLRIAGDGRARLFFLEGSLAHPRDERLSSSGRPCSTVEEFPGYVWRVSRDGYAKDEPVKENDHGIDATRYIVAAVDNIGRPEVVVRFGSAKSRVSAPANSERGWR